MRINKTQTNTNNSAVAARPSSPISNIQAVNSNVFYRTKTINIENIGWCIEVGAIVSQIQNIYIHLDNSILYYQKATPTSTLSGKTYFKIQDIDSTIEVTSNVDVSYSITTELQAERYIQENATNMLPSGGRASSLQSYQKDLEFLLQKIEANRKLITLWDVYNIKSVAYNRNDLLTQLGGLSTNSSLVVNLEEGSTVVGGNTYNSGDVVIKDIYGQNHIIPGSNGGYYFPYSCEPISSGTSTHKLVFKYSNTIPTEQESDVTAEGTKPALKLNLQLSQGQAESNNDLGGYNLTIDLRPVNDASGENEHTFSKKYGDNWEYIPVVYYYYDNERILFDNDFSWNGKEYIVKNPTYFQLKCEVR